MKGMLVPRTGSKMQTGPSILSGSCRLHACHDVMLGTASRPSDAVPSPTCPPHTRPKETVRARLLPWHQL